MSVHGISFTAKIFILQVILIWIFVLFNTSVLLFQGKISEQQYSVQPTTDVINTVNDIVTSNVAKPPISKEPIVNNKPLTIVLSTGNGLWNTGVWSGYGHGNSITLNWQHQGIRVIKPECPVNCKFTHDQNNIKDADAVVMEVVNHSKFLGDRADSVPFPFPERRNKNPNVPLFVSFFFEPVVNFPQLEEPEFTQNFDISMHPSHFSDVPVTMICPWGKDFQSYYKMPDLASKRNLVVYFNEHGIASSYRRYVTELVNTLGNDIHAFQTLKNQQIMPPKAKTPSTRPDFIGEYYFALVTESVSDDDWVESEWSQALLGGAVPIYIGAPNIADYAPDSNSFINLRDWVNRPPSAFATFLRGIAADKVSYSRYLQWKSLPPSKSFKEKADNCVFYAECRLCQEVKKRIDKSKKN